MRLLLFTTILFFLSTPFLSAQSPCDTVPQVAAAGQVSGPAYLQNNATGIFYIAPVSGATSYTWTAPPGSTINGLNPPVTFSGATATQISLKMGANSGDVCVTPSNSCHTGVKSCTALSLDGSFPAPCPSNTTPGADNCADVCVNCNLMSYSGSTSGYTANASDPGSCGVNVNSQWIAFIAAAPTTGNVKAVSSNCTQGNGIKFAVYESCASNALPVVCYSGCPGCMNAQPTISLSDLHPYQTYYMMIDGYAGDQCDFTLSFTTPYIEPGTWQVGNIQGPSQICPGGTAAFSIPPVPGASGYVWTVPAGSTIQSQGGVVAIGSIAGNKVTVTFGNTPGSVCVQPFNSCANGPTKCKTVAVPPVPINQLPTKTVCAEEAPYLLPWGDDAYVSGVYSHSFASAGGCDSVVSQKVVVKQPLLTNLPNQFICNGGSVNICGQYYTQPGSYTQVCTSYQGCDSTINLTILEAPSPVAEIIGSGILTCTNPTVTLTSTPAAGIKTWKNLAGQIVGTGASVTVNTPGIYILQVKTGPGCFTYDTVAVAADYLGPIINGGPGASISADTVPSTFSIGKLYGHSSWPNATYTWTWFGGTSHQQNITGIGYKKYTLVVTSPAGCTSSATGMLIVKNGLPTAVDDPEKTSLWQVSPNPADSRLTIHYTGDDLPSGVRIKLVDQSGRVVIERQCAGETDLDLSQLPSAFYALVIQSSGMPDTRVILVEHR